MRSAVIGHDVRHLKCRVELVPVRTRRPQAGEVADVDSWYAWVVISDVTVEAGNAEPRADARQVVHVEVVQCVEVDAVVAGPKIVEQARAQRVRVGEQPVLVHAGLRDHLDRNGRRRVSDVGGVTVVPVIAEVQPYLVADVLVDACEDLVDVVGRGSVGLHVGRYPRLVRRRVGLEKLQRDRGQLRPGNDVAWKRLARDGLTITRIAHGLPAGTGLEFADELTLSRALEGRRELK